MFTAVLFFVKTALAGLLHMVLSLVAFLMDHPKVLIGVVCLSLGLAGGWYAAQGSADRKVARIQKILDQAKLDAKLASDKVREESKAEADKNEVQLSGLQTQLADVRQNYDKALKANKKITYVKVPVPGNPSATVDVGFEGDKQICRSYPSTYVDQVNDMVRKTEEALK